MKPVKIAIAAKRVDHFEKKEPENPRSQLTNQPREMNLY